MAYPGAKLSGGGSGGPPAVEDVPKVPESWYVPKREPPMMRHQGTLPRLPVPALEQSLSMYLNSVRPLCNEAQWKHTQSAVLEFMTGSQGAELQALLEKRAAEKGDSSWLVDWWNELCYFGYRDPVTIWVSYFYEFTPDNWSGMRQSYRAAGYVKAALRYRDLIRTEKMPCDMAGGRPQDMSMYPYLFNSTRMAAPVKDYYVTYDKFKFNHVVVICKGHIYTVEVGTGASELSLDQVAAQFDTVIADAATAEGIPVGVLTTENRDVWAANRKRLEEVSPANREAIRTIDTSALVVCLDDAEPQTAEERCRNLWHGDGKSRWYDKPMQFVVCKNGHAGFVGEHGIMDGQPTNACTDWVLNRLAAPGGVKSVDTKPVTTVLPPRRLSFAVPDGSCIGKAFAEFDKLTGSQIMRTLNWTRFGKNGIKKLRVSPDAFVQMAIQLAYKRVHGDSAATYEACSTRQYLHGRTETIRSCHVPGARFVEAMDDPSVSAKNRYALLKKAAEHQGWYTKRAVRGHGCDRHLMGLKLLADPNNMPAIFKDPTYAKSTAWVLSTSALVSEHFASWGFGEVVPNGYGIGYLLNKENISFTISTLTTHPKPAPELVKALEQAIQDMYATCAEALSSKAKL